MNITTSDVNTETYEGFTTLSVTVTVDLNGRTMATAQRFVAAPGS